MDNLDTPHKSVMLGEVLKYLNPQKGRTYIDGTFGAGGYSKAILQKAKCRLIAIDRDESTKKYAEELAKSFGDFKLEIAKFSEIDKVLAKNDIEALDGGIVLDLGVSSMQLDQKDRGFSFNSDARLDMRMGKCGIDAEYVINNYPEKKLADIIYRFGDERKSRKIASLISAAREEAPIKTCKELSEIIHRAVGSGNKKIDPATKTFQAIRIEVNNELREVTEILELSNKLLAPGAIMVIVTFHSLEDEIVKNHIKNVCKDWEEDPIYGRKKKPAAFKTLTKKAVKPSNTEVNDNPRARSAKLRAFIKTDIEVKDE